MGRRMQGKLFKLCLFFFFSCCSRRHESFLRRKKKGNPKKEQLLKIIKIDDMDFAPFFFCFVFLLNCVLIICLACYPALLCVCTLSRDEKGRVLNMLLLLPLLLLLPFLPIGFFSYGADLFHCYLSCHHDSLLYVCLLKY
ncbi:hypothetical protein HDV63DRAFT_205048 [Trichoderma sp. SZMC 28014]